MLRGIWGDPQRYKEIYWNEVKGSYFTGDGCRQDKDGYFWIVGRIDDVLNVAGHRIGTAEVESALVSNQKVAEAAVVGRPDELKGQALVAFVTPKGRAPRPNCVGSTDHVAKKSALWRGRTISVLPGAAQDPSVLQPTSQTGSRGYRDQRRHDHVGGFQRSCPVG
jgi:acyl-coenzyme A synthetase/AMP-(fatty) acid ligase